MGRDVSRPYLLCADAFDVASALTTRAANRTVDSFLIVVWGCGWVASGEHTPAVAANRIPANRFRLPVARYACPAARYPIFGFPLPAASC